LTGGHNFKRELCAEILFYELCFGGGRENIIILARKFLYMEIKNKHSDKNKEDTSKREKTWKNKITFVNF